MKESVGIRAMITGQVQGVGFRPWLYRLATTMDLTGSVRNTREGVDLHLGGAGENLRQFFHRLPLEKPPAARISSIRQRQEAYPGRAGFHILPSTGDARPGCWPLDQAPCGDCLQEFDDPRSRRFGYVFITCCTCGPRYTIGKDLPFDRARTTMDAFPLCPRCRAEFNDPRDRRFHAQTMSCPDCGPRLQWEGQPKDRVSPLQEAIRCLQAGGLLALKGIGGFQLLGDARRQDVITRLRRIKRRPEKPFALMVRDGRVAAGLVRTGPFSLPLLESPAAPIVLLPRLPEAGLPGVAPDLDTLGIMLPASPLHRTLARACDFPLLVTSANRPGEPIIIDDAAAREFAREQADGLLTHNRRIVHAADDTVCRIIGGKAVTLRPGRGTAPLTLTGAVPPTRAVLATGGLMKNTLALGTAGSITMSPHMGDPGQPAVAKRMLQEATAMLTRHGLQQVTLSQDAHPAARLPSWQEPRIAGSERISHHEAHVRSCLAGKDVFFPLLAIAWDGLGLGREGQLLGGEAYEVHPTSMRRVGSLFPLPLPGGDAAAREPRRMALAVLGALGRQDGDQLRPETAEACQRIRADFTSREWQLLFPLARGELDTPTTSSVGRLFDAVAGLLRLKPRCSWEGQAAAILEDRVPPVPGRTRPAPSFLHQDGRALFDWRPLMRHLLQGLQAGLCPDQLAAEFHLAMSDVIIAWRRMFAADRVALTGGVFQNARLSTDVQRRDVRFTAMTRCHHPMPAWLSVRWL